MAECAFKPVLLCQVAIPKRLNLPMNLLDNPVAIRQYVHQAMKRTLPGCIQLEILRVVDNEDLAHVIRVWENPNDG